MDSIILTYQDCEVIPLSFKGYDDSAYYTCGFNGGIYYKNRENIFNSSYYVVGDFGDNIYSIEDGKAVIQCKLISKDHDTNDILNIIVE